MRRGDSSSNIIIFLTILIAAIILVTWYVQAVMPTRQIIGAAMEDLQELSQHFTNACSATRYNATYLFATPAGIFEGNETHFCIYTEAYGNCKQYPFNCGVAEQRITLTDGLIIRIERSGAAVTLTST